LEQNDPINKLIEDLINLPQETEWVEFKKNNYNSVLIVKNISALSNSACLHDEDYGYLLFGIEDKTHEVTVTKFKPKECKKGNEELENWLAPRTTTTLISKLLSIFIIVCLL